jgi:chromate transporter
MAKINLLAFGGGYTAVALMYEQVVRTRGWLTSHELLDGLALGQVTPGPVIVTATFIGYRIAGVAGAVFATACIFLPSALILLVVAPQFARVRDLKPVNCAIRGLLAGFMGMLFNVLWQVAHAGVTDLFTAGLTLASIAALLLRPNPALIVLGAVALSLLLGR